MYFWQGSIPLNEFGVRLEYNEGAIVAKCGIYITQMTDSDGNTWDCVTMACTGVGLTSVTLVPFFSLNGTTTLDGMTEGSGFNTFAMSQDSYGVWSKGGAYELVRNNLIDADGKPVVTTGSGSSGINSRGFTDLDEMKSWLNE